MLYNTLNGVCIENNVSPSTESRLKKDTMRARPVKISNNTIRKSNAYSYCVLF